MGVIATRFLKKGKEPLLGSFGALIQCILPDVEGKLFFFLLKKYVF